MTTENQIKPKENQIFNRKTSKIRWIILVLISFSSFGGYYCVDNVAVLHDSLKSHMNNRKEFEYFFSLLYSAYNIPNIFLPLIGGLLIFKYGSNKILLLVSIFLLLGQVVFSYGSTAKSMITMLIGRVLFGFGGEIINIIQNCIIIKWFKKNELSFPFGIAITIARLGSVLNDVISPRISAYFKNDPSFAFWTGGLVVLMSCLSSIILIILEKYIDSLVISTSQDIDIDNQIEPDRMEINDILSFDYILWLIIVSCVVLYSGFIPFNNIASGFLISQYFSEMTKSDAENLAGIYMATPFFISAIMVPVFGFIIDNIGRRSYVILISSVFGVLTFISFKLIHPLASMILLGLTYSLFASVIWPSISLVTSKSQVGVAFGVATSIQNFGLAVVPVFVAFVLTRTKSYDYVIVLFIVLFLIGFVVSLVIIQEDSVRNGVINRVSFSEDEERKEETVETEKDKEKYCIIESNSDEELTKN